METDPTRRFSQRVEDYIRYRPSYPPDVTALLGRECGLRHGASVADIGCGTGILTRLLLEAGAEVFGVEPNAGMRQASARILAANPCFHAIDGRAEATTLADAAVDLVTASQAFHWFDADRARIEFRRILKPRGWVALIWNERLRNDGGFMDGYEAAIREYAPEHPRIRPDDIGHFFLGGAWQLARFSNQQHFDRAGLRGRLASSSYAPLPGTPEFQILTEALDRLFDAWQSGGLVTVLYETSVYYGSWP